MAIVSCAECTGTVSDRAPSCPHCGFVRGGARAATVAVVARATPPAAATTPRQQAKPGTVWPWLAAVAGATIGRQLAEVAAFLGASQAGVTDDFVTPHMAALAKAHEIGPRTGILVGALAGYIAAYAIGPRRCGLIVSALAGLLAGAAAGAVAGFLAGYY